MGDVAWAHSTSVALGRMGDREINSHGAELVVLPREGGTWKIKAIHLVIPAAKETPSPSASRRSHGIPSRVRPRQDPGKKSPVGSWKTASVAYNSRSVVLLVERQLQVAIRDRTGRIALAGEPGRQKATRDGQ